MLQEDKVKKDCLTDQAELPQTPLSHGTVFLFQGSRDHKARTEELEKAHIGELFYLNLSPFSKILLVKLLLLMFICLQESQKGYSFKGCKYICHVVFINFENYHLSCHLNVCILTQYIFSSLIRLLFKLIVVPTYNE